MDIDEDEALLCAVEQCFQQASDRHGLTGEAFLLLGTVPSARKDCPCIDIQLRCDFVAYLIDRAMLEATDATQVVGVQGIAATRMKRRIWQAVKRWLLQRGNTFFVVTPSADQEARSVQEKCITLSPARNNVALFIERENEKQLAEEVLVAIDDALINNICAIEEAASEGINRSAR